MFIPSLIDPNNAKRNICLLFVVLRQEKLNGFFSANFHASRHSISNGEFGK